MEVRKITMHEVLKCGMDENVEEIAKKLKEKKDRRIFVIDNHEVLKGIITTTDIVYKAIGKEGLKAEDIMTTNIKSIESEEDLNKALEIMEEIKSYVCPVTENGKLLGIITYHDLVSYMLNSIKHE
ncbi:hypothetical protein COU61_02320 [Candidatus Pacearchaeota archaeon CG10_big_fil_rev_8_21_14_0_10_35_13]|nr:MAG: hypothetical protein COU61_02320 [Candidatus Pacearchaeota archaeon CG10_big_fil_rev_8_21_14_0_10_35_13]